MGRQREWDLAMCAARRYRIATEQGEHERARQLSDEIDHWVDQWSEDTRSAPGEITREAGR